MPITRYLVPAVLVALLCFPLVTPPPLAADTLHSSTQPRGTLSPSLRNEVQAAVDRGLDWLIAQQKKDGSWSNGSFPALTALPLRAMLMARRPTDKASRDTALAYLVSCVKADGGIYRDVEGRKGGGLSNYNTAICMTAVHAAGKREHIPIVLNARQFVAEGQHMGDDVYRGGFGYDRNTKRAYTDLLNTYYTAEAMRITQSSEDLRQPGEKRVDINWDATLAYVEKMQNKEAAGSENAGGFSYNPSDPKAGATTNANGVVVFRSYGSITYAGMLALIYANVKPDDARVLSALDWSARHWTLEENPGMGNQGLFFFYNVLSKALSAAGRDLVPLKDGRMLNWREELAQKLVAMQKIDPKTGRGYWVNDTGRFWENDPVLASSYILLALQMLD